MAPSVESDESRRRCIKFVSKRLWSKEMEKKKKEKREDIEASMFFPFFFFVSSAFFI